MQEDIKINFVRAIGKTMQRISLNSLTFDFERYFGFGQELKIEVARKGRFKSVQEKGVGQYKESASLGNPSGCGKWKKKWEMQLRSEVQTVERLLKSQLFMIQAIGSHSMCCKFQKRE